MTVIREGVLKTYKFNTYFWYTLWQLNTKKIQQQDKHPTAKDTKVEKSVMCAQECNFSIYPKQKPRMTKSKQ